MVTPVTIRWIAPGDMIMLVVSPTLERDRCIMPMTRDVTILVYLVSSPQSHHSLGHACYHTLMSNHGYGYTGDDLFATYSAIHGFNHDHDQPRTAITTSFTVVICPLLPCLQLYFFSSFLQIPKLSLIKYLFDFI